MESARREAQRRIAAEEKERKRLYVEMRSAEVDAMNARLNVTITRLENLLAEALLEDAYVDFEAMKQAPVDEPFEPGPLGVPAPEPQLATFMPQRPSTFSRLVPAAKAKFEASVEDGQARFDEAMTAYTEAEGQREHSLERARAEHEEAIAIETARAQRATRPHRRSTQGLRGGVA